MTDFYATWTPLALGHATRAPYAVGADGRRALFVADPNVRGVFELFRVGGGRLRSPLQLSGDEVRLASRAGSVQDFVLASGRALYRAAQELDDVVGLYSVPLDGSAPRVKLNGILVAGGDVAALAQGGLALAFAALLLLLLDVAPYLVLGGPALGGAHAAVEHHEILRELLEAASQMLEMITPLRENDRPTTCF